MIGNTVSSVSRARPGIVSGRSVGLVLVAAALSLAPVSASAQQPTGEPRLEAPSPSQPPKNTSAANQSAPGGSGSPTFGLTPGDVFGVDARGNVVPFPKPTVTVIDGPPVVNGPLPKPSPFPVIADADVAAVVAAMVGSWRCEAPAAGAFTGDIPPLHMHVARVRMEGLDNALYFEVARADDPPRPFQQGFFHVYRGAQGVRVRLMQTLDRNVARSLVGLWAAPDVFPAYVPTQFDVLLDMPMTKGADGVWQGKTEGQNPGFRAGAWFIESTMRVGGEGAAATLELADRGFDQKGQQVWGALGDNRLKFSRITAPVRVTTGEQGMTIIDLVPAKAGAEVSADGKQLAVHNTTWLWADGQEVATTRGENGQPVMINLPSKQMIPGFRTALAGMGQGTWRRVVMPWGLAFQERGAGRIPPMAHLIYELECVFVGPSPEAAAPPVDKKN